MAAGARDEGRVAADGPRASVTSRVLAILGCFTSARPALTLTAIAHRTGLPLATAHRLAGELLAGGVLERGEDLRYRIGLRLWEIASLAPRGLGLREAAMPVIEDLYEATHENVQLAVRDGSQVVYVERVSGRDSVSVLSRAGARWPMHATGVGLVLLAHAPVEVQEEVLAGPLERFTELTLVDPRRLRAALAEVRRTGVAVSDRQVTLDALSVAAPVRGARGEVVAALSLVVRADAAEPRGLALTVRAAALGISRALGAPPPRLPR